MGLLSSVRTEVLDNGLKIAVFQVKRPIVDLRIAVGAGTITEGHLAGSGVSHFLEHMLFRGTPEYTRQEIANMVPNHGGDINAYTCDNKTVVEMSVLREYFEESLAMGLSMVMSPSLDQHDFDEERNVVRREICMSKDDSFRRSWYQLLQTECGGSPLAYPVLGVEEIFYTLTRDDMVRYHDRLYVPGNCVVVAVGDVEIGEFADMVRERCGNWKPRSVVRPQFSFSPYGGRVVRSTFNDKSDCLILARTIASSSEGFAYSVMMDSLVGSDVSPICKELVLDRRLALDCSGGVNYTIGENGFAYMIVHTKNGAIPAAEKYLLAILKKISKTGIPNYAINASQRSLRQYYFKSQKTDYAHIANAIVESWLIDGSPDFADKSVMQKLEVTKEQADDALRGFLSGLGPDIITVSAKPIRKTGKVLTPGGDGLENLNVCGCPVVFEHARDEECVDCMIALPGGRINEPADGLAAGRLFNGLVMCGGNGMKEERFRKEISRLDASVSVRAGRSNSVISFNVPAKNLKRLGELFRPVIDAPEFSETQFERERDNLRVKIKSLDVDPLARALQEALALQYGTGHLFCSHCDLSAIGALTRDKVLECWRRIWQKGRCVMSIAGGCTREAAVNFAETLLSTPVMHKRIPSSVPEIPECRQAERNVVIAGREQLGVVKSTIIPAHSEPFPLMLSSLIDELFSAGSGRLFKRVREDNSLAYFVEGSCGMCYENATELLLVASCAPERCGDVERLFDEEIRFRARYGLTKDEFTRVKAAMKMKTARRSEDPQRMCLAWVNELYSGLEPMSAERKFEFYSNLKYDDVVEQIRNLFRGKSFVVARAGAPIPKGK